MPRIRTTNYEKHLRLRHLGRFLQQSHEFIKSHFNMNHWKHEDPECGVAGCAGLWAEMIFPNFKLAGYGGVQHFKDNMARLKKFFGLQDVHHAIRLFGADFYKTSELRDPEFVGKRLEQEADLLLKTSRRQRERA